MKQFVLSLVLISICITSMADWTYGTARFIGDQPSNCKIVGGVTIYYNGSLSSKCVEGNTEYWEGTGNICVIFPKNYIGRQMVFLSSGGTVQVQHLKYLWK